MKTLLLFSLCAITAANGQTAPDAPKAQHVIRLIYDDTQLSDASRAAVISILAKEPESSQTVVQVTAADVGLTKLVQNTLHLSGKTDPISVQATIAAITENNSLDSAQIHVGQTILLPSLPPHVYRENGLPKPTFRVADAKASPMTAAVGPADFVNTATSFNLDDPRNADGTAKELANPSRLAQLAWSQSGTPVLPPGVHPIEDDGNVSVHLSDGGKCLSASWLDSSPLHAKLRTAIAAQLAKPGETARIQQAAQDLPLVIIDWNDADKKHGQKVTSVAQYLLSDLGLQGLPVHIVDLNPANNSAELQIIFKDYLTAYYCSINGMNCSKADQKALISDVTGWLTSKPKSNNGIASVKQLLLEAVLWKFFASSRAVINMSFSIDSLALEILQTQFLAASHSIGVSAASDDLGPEGTVGIPQRAAAQYPSFMNVTYGNLSGEVLGSFTNDRFNVVVTTVAQGCGYTFQDIFPTDSGTSFASPYVATAIWLRTLLSGGDITRARRDLVEAAFVSDFSASPLVESSGVFDLPSFLLPSAHELLDTHGHLIEISSGSLQLVVQRDTGGTIQFNYVLEDHPNIAFVHRGTTLFARVREMRTSGPPIPVADTKEFRVVDATLRYTIMDGTVVDYNLAEVSNHISEVKF